MLEEIWVHEEEEEEEREHDGSLNATVNTRQMERDSHLHAEIVGWQNSAYININQVTANVANTETVPQNQEKICTFFILWDTKIAEQQENLNKHKMNLQFIFTESERY